ncbi:MAG TPA: L-threonylcarbamoyladenylate synthase [Thermoanaerobaculia bacterium]|nr:L-threonylcarbamoyladenylate synthase [Thermoanaerobaculia bacterium]
MTCHWKASPPEGPSETELAEIAAVLTAGGVVILPTDTIYGLHAMASSAPAIARIAGLKGRDSDKPLIVLAASVEQLRTLGAEPSNDVDELLESIWPAPLTAILPLHSPIAASGGRTTLGARIPDVAWLRRLIDTTGPLVSTSVNPSGNPPLESTANLEEATAKLVDGVLHYGQLSGEPSTIVDFTGENPVVLREGAFGFTQKLRKMLWKTL